MNRDEYEMALASGFVLYPCPFCGGKAVKFVTPANVYVECINYNVDWHAVRIRAGSEYEAVKIWNGRRARE